MKPPKRFRGKLMMGAKATAVVSWLKILERQYPMEEAA
jgi:hypothetical protein